MSLLRAGWTRRTGLAVAVRRLVGLVLGCLSTFVEIGFLLVALTAWQLPSGRPWILATARRLAEYERRRIERYFAPTCVLDYTDHQAMRYVAVRWLVGGLGTGVLVMVLLGALTALFQAQRIVTGQPSGPGPSAWYVLVMVLVGVVLAFVTLRGMSGVVELDLETARRLLGPNPQDLRRRVSELTVSRSELVEAVNDERRRIERDLHDGIQQQLVSLGLLLGRAGRVVEPERRGDLVRQAHEEVARALADLREVSWRVYPPALDSEGLQPALRNLAERSGLPVRLRYELAGRYPSTVEVPAYFVAAEAVTNASKHANATWIDISVSQVGNMVVVRVSDDGPGGANPAGGGLSGLRRRVAAVDGVFTVASPAGGPTVITAALPCG